jgi:septal ring factor EnvC (AmiA/AmiB activator)
MASTNPNLVKRLYENLMGTPEENAKAAKDIAAYKAAKEKEKAKAAEEEAKKKAASSTTNMAKGGSVKKKTAVPAKGKTVKSGSKAAKAGKAPLLVIAVKPKMAKGGSVATKKKGKC